MALLSALLTAQFVREFAKLGLTRSVGGVLGLALSRELTPVITSIILAGKAGMPMTSVCIGVSLADNYQDYNVRISFLEHE